MFYCYVVYQGIEQGHDHQLINMFSLQNLALGLIVEFQYHLLEYQANLTWMLCSYHHSLLPRTVVMLENFLHINLPTCH